MRECLQFDSAKHRSFSSGIPVSSRGNTGPTTEGSYWTFRENSLELFKETMSTTMHLFTFYLESDGMSTNNDYKHFFGALSLQFC